ncbi:MAG: hypothetical protein ACI4WO_00110, partial [Porcipelethomonas sp.]
MNNERIQNEPDVTVRPPVKKKRKSKSGCASRLAKLILIVFIIWWFNNCTLKTTKAELKSDKVNNEIKIAVLSDQHASDKPFAISNKRIINKIKKMNPDVVCVLGDMHSSDATDTEKQISMDLMTDII